LEVIARGVTREQQQRLYSSGSTRSPQPGGQGVSGGWVGRAVPWHWSAGIRVEDVRLCYEPGSPPGLLDGGEL